MVIKLKEKIKNEGKNKNIDKLNLKNIIRSYKKYYNENLKKKHFVIFIIMIVIFFSVIGMLFSDLESIKNEIVTNQIVKESFFNNLINEKIPLLAVIIFAGITPFFFLPVLGIIGSYTLAFETISTYCIENSTLAIITGSIGSVIQLIAISLSISTGIYYCIQSTKKFRYSQQMNFGLKDVKKAIYEIRKNEEKLKQLEIKETKKAEEREKLNVKIPYINLIVSFVISALILIIGAVISSIN